MSKVTAKLQVTLPKALAEKYGIVPGSEIVWEAAGDAIRVLRLSGLKASALQ
jgi:bifunctional DNA-binding transcriptional regulator/antitoxin component of YhaV-PrlF toxin-antitoxin module